MADSDAQAIIRKALTDDVFRIGLSRDVDGTVKRYGLRLSTDEIAAMKQVDWSSRTPFGKGAAASASWVHVYKTGAAGLGKDTIAKPVR